MSKIYSMLFHPPKKVLELLLDQQATQLFTLGEGIKPVVWSRWIFIPDFGTK